MSQVFSYLRWHGPWPFARRNLIKLKNLIRIFLFGHRCDELILFGYNYCILVNNKGLHEFLIHPLSGPIETAEWKITNWNNKELNKTVKKELGLIDENGFCDLDFD